MLYQKKTFILILMAVITIFVMGANASPSNEGLATEYMNFENVNHARQKALLDRVEDLNAEDQKQFLKEIESLSEEEKAELAVQLNAYAEQELDELEQLLKPEAFASTVWESVPLGTTTMFTTADAGNCDADKSGLPIGIWDSEWYPSERKAEAVTVLYPSFGSAWGLAQCGKSFQVTGSGAMNANIIMEGYLYGLLGAILAASTTAEVELILLDITTNARYRTEIFELSQSAFVLEPLNKYFTEGLNVLLTAGHSYIAYIQTKTSGTSVSNGGMTSDFSRLDTDAGFTRYDSILIDFGQNTLVDIHTELQGTGRHEPNGWHIPLSVGFYPPGSSNSTLLDPAQASNYYTGVTTYADTDEGPRARLMIGPIPSGIYDITTTSNTTLMNVKTSVSIH